jgi:predicted cupin superfamily sugar epimerase
MDIERLKRTLHLKPLPEEGGFYAEPYRSDEKLARTCLPKRYAGDRCFGTAIYFLLTPETFSALHRLASDEVTTSIWEIRLSFSSCMSMDRARWLRWEPISIMR